MYENINNEFSCFLSSSYLIVELFFRDIQNYGFEMRNENKKMTEQVEINTAGPK